jgi:hypothetical protein
MKHGESAARKRKLVGYAQENYYNLLVVGADHKHSRTFSHLQDSVFVPGIIYPGKCVHRRRIIVQHTPPTKQQRPLAWAIIIFLLLTRTILLSHSFVFSFPHSSWHELANHVGDQLESHFRG